MLATPGDWRISNGRPRWGLGVCCPRLDAAFSEEDRSWSGTGLLLTSRLEALPTLEDRLLGLRLSSVLKTKELSGVRTISKNGTADNLPLTGSRLVS